MAVLVTDATIWTVDDQFGVLVACDVPPRVNGLLLRAVHRGCPLIAGALDGPTFLVRNYVLILACHGGFPKLNHRNPDLPAGVVIDRPL